MFGLDKTRVNADTLNLFKPCSHSAAVEEITKLEKFIASPFRQEIELQHVEHSAGFNTLRIRIRERSRFTIFDVDAVTAAKWGQQLLDWATQHGDAGAATGLSADREGTPSAG